MVNAPVIPEGVQRLGSTFKDCINLVTAPTIPASVTLLGYTFEGCTQLRGEIIVNANPNAYNDCFTNAVQTPNKLIIKGSATTVTKTALKNTGNANISIFLKVNKVIKKSLRM